MILLSISGNMEVEEGERSCPAAKARPTVDCISTHDEKRNQQLWVKGSERYREELNDRKQGNIAALTLLLSIEEGRSSKGKND